MIFKEIKVNTRRELLTLFEKLNNNGFTWATGDNLVDNIDIVDEMPAYIYLHGSNRNIVSWATEPIPDGLRRIMR